MIKVVLNNKEYELIENSTITTLLTAVGIEAKGIAIAVNNRVISYNDWHLFKLHNMDNIIIIKAACGG